MTKNLLDELKNLLQKDERLISDGELLKNKIIELALKIDKDLIELLLSDKQMKGVFFTEVGKATIFDKDKFIKFISNKQFLPDSYTAFKKKIGLVDEKDEFISEKADVVLSWPYKDCVLEGGMTKEDQKRDEIFWNETLAPDEISRLLDPKVFTNAKRIDKDGEHPLCHSELDSESCFKTDENGDIKDNLIIKGNNLLALHSLKKRFAGKVKLIYIDPPYNTGGPEDTFTYNNDFDHSTWLTFIKNRLEVAKNLLRNDGFIAITIDHVELFYLGALADEVFGRNNRVGIVTILHNPKGRNLAKFFSPNSEFMLVYAKNIEVAEFNRVIISEDVQKRFTEQDREGSYRYVPFMRARTVWAREKRPKNWYPIYISPDLKKITSEKKSGYYEVYPITNNGKEMAWKNIKETFDALNKKDYFIAKKENGKIRIYHKYREQQVYKNVWTDKKYQSEFQGTQLLKKLLGANLFSYPKSLYAVADTLKIMTSDDDIILDFFAGSGTTGHATLAVNEEDGGERKFILVEQLDNHIDVCLKRIHKVLQQSSRENDFVYMELAKWNENFVEKIEKAKTKEELKKLWEIMKEKAFLSYKVDIKTVDENAKDFEDLSIEDQKRFLLECLDKNHLYVNYSEIEDEEYGVSEDDKKINRAFYD
ncbi:MAG: site-specific DNA-methyltransferase [Candidatus Pacebacteria bacterium]|nr:site-specific DNA-methyltransferase [Candidatus Paceibacterota bacterium]